MKNNDSQGVQTSSSDSEVLAEQAAGDTQAAPRGLLRMSRKVTIAVLSVLGALTIAAAVVFGVLAYQNYIEAREKVEASHVRATGTVDSAMGVLGETIDAAIQLLDETEGEALDDPSILDETARSLADAERVLESGTEVEKLTLDESSNEEIEAHTSELNLVKQNLVKAKGLLADYIDEALESKERKRIADEEARKAKELAEKKANAGPITFESLFRSGNDVLGNYYTFEGKIIQAVGDGTYRVSVTKDPGYSVVFWQDPILLVVSGETDERLLEDDIVSFTASSLGIQSYETIFGASVELPLVAADGADIKVTGRD